MYQGCFETEPTPQQASFVPEAMSIPAHVPGDQAPTNSAIPKETGVIPQPKVFAEDGANWPKPNELSQFKVARRTVTKRNKDYLSLLFRFGFSDLVPFCVLAAFTLLGLGLFGAIPGCPSFSELVKENRHAWATAGLSECLRPSTQSGRCPQEETCSRNVSFLKSRIASFQDTHIGPTVEFSRPPRDGVLHPA
ncbi:hypothetical protein PAPYR_12718 [Paratrimastix pyriformis]|uniref:Uncharacterized protein n=1 Tax=Paratrimastix pyriformis TaxID=342808 RepID=A0ABQ8U1E6_9EUKA|nr:hypothetical protein PAPYR_12718 [Paratrimastix pyriformis]